MRKWPINVLSWAFDAAGVDPASAQHVYPIMSRAIRSWESVCNVSLPPTDQPGAPRLVVRFIVDLANDPSLSPEVKAQQGPLWLAGTELGLTDEPVDASPTTVLVMRLNPNPAGGYTDDELLKVVMHEAGHFLGCDHSAPGVPSCMEPILDLRVNTQQPWEIGIVQSLYGPPLSPPAAPPIVASMPPAVSSTLQPGAPMVPSSTIFVTDVSTTVGNLLSVVTTEVNATQLEQSVGKALAAGGGSAAVLTTVAGDLVAIIPNPLYREIALSAAEQLFVHQAAAVPPAAAAAS